MKKILVLLPVLILLNGCALSSQSNLNIKKLITPPTSQTPVNEGNQVACTMEAKICPDGSAVGRSGPNCEFAPCPGIQNPSGKNVLNLSSQKLTKVPDSVFNQTNLEELNVSNNQLTGALQSQIGQLKNLKILNASNNQMTGVPAEIGQLQNLQVLDLSNNQLTGLPNELANLKKLQVLNLKGNNYSTQDLEVIKRGLPANVNIITN